MSKCLKLQWHMPCIAMPSLRRGIDEKDTVSLAAVPWQQPGSWAAEFFSTPGLGFFTPRRFSWSSSWHWFLESILWKIMASSLKSCGFFPPIWKAFPCCLSNQAQKMSCIKAEDQLFKDDMAWCWCRLIDDSCGLLWGISTATGAFCHRVIECKGCCVSCIIYHLSPVTKSHEATQGRGQQMPVGFCLCLRNGWLPDGLWSQLGAPFLLQTLWAGCEQHDFGFSWNCLVLRLAESAVPRTLGLLWHACFMLLALDSQYDRDYIKDDRDVLWCLLPSCWVSEFQTRKFLQAAWVLQRSSFVTTWRSGWWESPCWPLACRTL